jgi:hypothetical protein
MKTVRGGPGSLNSVFGFLSGCLCGLRRDAGRR